MSWVAAAIAGSALLGAGTTIAVGKQNQKSQQPAPNYEDTVRAGIMADIDTLPLRLQVSQAAADGGVYTDPKTGQVYDFRGGIDPVRFYRDNPDAWRDYLDNPENRSQEQHIKDWVAHVGQNESVLDQYRTGSPAYKNRTAIDNTTQLATAGGALSINLAQQQVGALKGNNDYARYVNSNPDLKAAFEASGETDIAAWGKRHYDTYGQKEGRLLVTDGLAQQVNDLNLNSQKQAVQAQLDLMPKIGDAQRTQDSATFRNNLALGVEGTKVNADLQQQVVPQLNDLSLRMQEDAFKRGQTASQTAFQGNLNQADEAARRAVAQQQQTLPGLNDLSLRLQSDAYTQADATGRQVNGGLYAIRDEYARGLLDELKAGSDLTAAQKNKVQQRIRGAQASRGNILGAGAAFDEAIAESDYAENLVNNRRAAALGLINSRDLAPKFSPVDVLNPTQVVRPNLSPANFTATTSVNPLMPNFGTPSAPTIAPTTTGVPSLQPVGIQPADPLALLNPNAGNQASQYDLNAWNSQQNRVANAPNPWMQGVGVALQGYSTFAPTPKPKS